jgi:hypothetical protein
MRYWSLHERLVDTILGPSGVTGPELRRAALERARGIRAASDGLPKDLAGHVDTVARHAYKVTDADVAALQRGHSDDALFEITVAAAVGAALHRLDRGVAALRGEETD